MILITTAGKVKLSCRRLSPFRRRWLTGFTLGMFIGTDALTDLSPGIAQARLARLA